MNSDNKISFMASVDRIESAVAVLVSFDQDIPTLQLPLRKLGLDVQEGNVLRISIEKDEKAEEKRLNEVKDLQKSLLHGEHLK